jgi:hypothetical protein
MSEEIWVQEDNVRRKLEGEELQAFLADRAARQEQHEAQEAAKAARRNSSRIRSSKTSSLRVNRRRISKPYQSNSLLGTI